MRELNMTMQTRIRRPMLLLIVLAGAWTTGSAVRCGGCVDVGCGRCVCTIHPDGCVTANCTGTNITSVPDIVPNNTCVLIMRETNMESIPDFSFQRLTNLTSLDLSVNAIQNISEHAFTGLTSLAYLNLSQNNLDFNPREVQLQAFSSLGNLETLELDGNSYERYPDVHLSELKSLKNLTLDGLNTSLGPSFSKLKKLSFLDLSRHTSKGRCRLNSLCKDMFKYVTRLRYLNISHCRIREVEQGVLSSLRKLGTLDVSFNECLLFEGFSNLTYGLNETHLRQLFMTHVVPSNAGCVQVTKEEVQYLQNTNLEYLDASDNRIEFLTVQALEALPKSLKTIIARNNLFTQGNYSRQLHVLKNLTFMDLSGEKLLGNLFQFLSEPSELDVNRERCKVKYPQPRLVTPFENNRYDLYHEKRTRNRTLVHIPPKLRNITYTFSELKYRLADIYIANNSLGHIDLSYNLLVMWPGPVFGVENITYLDLSYNFAAYVNYTFFENFKSLQFLNVSYNFLGYNIKDDDKGLLFRNNGNLEILDLSHNNLVFLPYRLIEGLPRLLELNISNNIIKSLELNLTSNTKLKSINMSDNSVSFITPALRNTLDKLADANNLSLDLSWNPFQCTCDPEHLDFLDWLFTSKVKFMNMNNYTCDEYDNSKSRSNHTDVHTVYNKLKLNCKLYIVLSMGLLSVTVLLTTIVICGIVYRYRWRLIYIYYMGKRQWKKRQKYEQIYDFDAFVSYADADAEFVTPLMLSRLESDQGLNLYIRHRDSTPGDSIAEVIIDAIQRSRKSVVLVSQASLAKKWCRYELQMANQQGITSKKNVLILVLMETVPNNDIPREILFSLKNNPPLQYPGQGSDQTMVFWESLAEEIRS